jgi:hypothetical protein
MLLDDAVAQHVSHVQNSTFLKGGLQEGVSEGLPIRVSPKVGIVHLATCSQPKQNEHGPQ